MPDSRVIVKTDLDSLLHRLIMKGVSIDDWKWMADEGQLDLVATAARERRRLHTESILVPPAGGRAEIRVIKVKEQEIPVILLKMPPGHTPEERVGQFAEALKWAEARGWVPSEPGDLRGLFKTSPKLHDELGFGKVGCYIASTSVEGSMVSVFRWAPNVLEGSQTPTHRGQVGKVADWYLFRYRG